MSTAELAGLGQVVHLVVRRDRLRLLLWVAGLVLVVLISAASLPPVYPDQAAIENYVRLFGDNPALVAMAGPGHGFDDPNIGVILVNEVQLFACIGAALLSLFLVNRHTRAEEDDERVELLRSSVVGRDAPIAAAVLVVVAAQLVVAACCLVGLLALDYPTTGSVAMVGSVAASGLAFTGVAAVAAQMAGTSRASLGLGAAVLGWSFVLRAYGDIADNALRWLSPIGWAQAVRAYADERWWTLGLCAALGLGSVALAFALAARRDLGSGLLPTRPGPPRAAARLLSPFGLAFQLQRGFLAGWTVGLFALGVVYGSIAEDIEEMIEDTPFFEDVLAQFAGVDIVDSFLATGIAMLALLATGFGLATVLRLRSDELSARAEPLLAGVVGRTRWAMSQLAVAAIGVTVVMAAAGAGAGASYAVISGDPGQVLRLVGAGLATVPGVLVLAALALALHGLVPGQSMAVWAVFAVLVVIDLLGDALNLPDWTARVSPLHQAPAVPAEPFELLPVGVLLLVGAAFSGLGLIGLHRRDLRLS